MKKIIWFFPELDTNSEAYFIEIRSNKILHLGDALYLNKQGYACRRKRKGYFIGHYCFEDKDFSLQLMMINLNILRSLLIGKRVITS